MNVEYKFQAVGQGCFFTSTFERHNHSTVNIIYDCGTDSKGSFLRKAIADYKAKLPSKQNLQIIDMLVISHFHEDHVNGVFDLLKGCKCKKLVIPYITIWERLALLAKGKPKAEWHIQLLRDPISFFAENDFDIEQIIVVGGNAELVNLERNEEPSSPVDGNNEVIEGLVIPSSSKELNSDAIELFSTSYNSTNFNGLKVSFFKIPFSLTLWGIWNFKFYNRITDTKMMDEFRNDVERDFPKVNIHDLFSEETRIRIKELYKRNFKNVNFSSLSLACTPATNRYFGDFFKFGHIGHRWLERAGILLTGDGDLETTDKVEKFSDYFKDELSKILIYQIPHHGSIKNSLLKPDNQLIDFPFTIINHGHGRKKHPSPKLVKFLVKNNRIPFYNTEHQPFVTDFHMVI